MIKKWKEEDIRKAIQEILVDCGIVLLEDEEEEILEMDSMQFVSVIVQMEDAFDIVIEDEYLSENEITMSGLIDIVNRYNIDRNIKT